MLVIYCTYLVFGFKFLEFHVFPNLCGFSHFNSLIYEIECCLVKLGVELTSLHVQLLHGISNLSLNYLICDWVEIPHLKGENLHCSLFIAAASVFSSCCPFHLGGIPFGP